MVPINIPWISHQYRMNIPLSLDWLKVKSTGNDVFLLRSIGVSFKYPLKIRRNDIDIPERSRFQCRFRQASFAPGLLRPMLCIPFGCVSHLGSVAYILSKTWGFVAVPTTTTITLHYIILRYTPLQLQLRLQLPLPLHYTTLHYTNYTTPTLRYTTLHSITLHNTNYNYSHNYNYNYTTCHYTTLFTLHFTSLHSITLH